MGPEALCWSPPALRVHYIYTGKPPMHLKFQMEEGALDASPFAEGRWWLLRIWKFMVVKSQIMIMEDPCLLYNHYPNSWNVNNTKHWKVTFLWGEGLVCFPGLRERLQTNVYNWIWWHEKFRKQLLIRHGSEIRDVGGMSRGWIWPRYIA